MKKRQLISIHFVLLWVIAISLAIVAIFMTLHLKKTPKTRVVNVGSVLLNDGEEEASVGRGYANETSYSGDGYVPASLFDYPFKKTDSYIMNKDYINTIGAEEAKILSDRICDALEQMYTINYETADEGTLKSILEEYISENVFLYSPESGESMDTVEDIATVMHNALVSDNLIMESKAYSDKCMVYHDENCDIIRVKLTRVVYRCDDAKNLEKFFGIKGIEIGKPFSVIYDIYTTPDVRLDERASYVITRILRVSE